TEVAFCGGRVHTARNASLLALHAYGSAIDYPGALVCTRRDRRRSRQPVHAGAEATWLDLQRTTIWANICRDRLLVIPLRFSAGFPPLRYQYVAALPQPAGAHEQHLPPF